MDSMFFFRISMPVWAVALPARYDTFTVKPLSHTCPSQAVLKNSVAASMSYVGASTEVS